MKQYTNTKLADILARYTPKLKHKEAIQYVSLIHRQLPIGETWHVPATGHTYTKTAKGWSR